MKLLDETTMRVLAKKFVDIDRDILTELEKTVVNVLKINGWLVYNVEENVYKLSDDV